MQRRSEPVPMLKSYEFLLQKQVASTILLKHVLMGGRTVRLRPGLIQAGKTPSTPIAFEHLPPQSG